MKIPAGSKRQYRTKKSVNEIFGFEILLRFKQYNKNK